MGNLIQNELADDVAQITEEVGHTITWKGTEYACAVTEPRADADVESGGIFLDGEFQIKIPRVLLTSGTPQHDNRVTFDGEIYRVIAVPNKPDSAYFIFQIAV